MTTSTAPEQISPRHRRHDGTTYPVTIVINHSLPLGRHRQPNLFMRLWSNVFASDQTA